MNKQIHLYADGVWAISIAGYRPVFAEISELIEEDDITNVSMESSSNFDTYFIYYEDVWLFISEMHESFSIMDVGNGPTAFPSLRGGYKPVIIDVIGEDDSKIYRKLRETAKRLLLIECDERKYMKMDAIQRRLKVAMDFYRKGNNNISYYGKNNYCGRK